MKNISVVLTVLLLMVLLIPASFVDARAEFDIAITHTELEESSTHQGMLLFKELVEERSNGRISVYIHPMSELAAAAGQVELVQFGSVQLGVLPAGYFGGIIPLVQIFDIPFLLPRDLKYTNELINGPAGMALLAYLEKADLVGLANFPLSFKQFTNNHPIRRPEDFQGLAIRTMPSPIIGEGYRLMGASTEVIDYHEVYTALQLGTVDGQENPYWALGKMRFYEVQKYLTESNHGVFCALFIANQDWYNNLPDDIREIITETAQEITEFVYKSDQDYDNYYRDIVYAYDDIEVIHLSGEEVQAFKEALYEVRQVYIRRVGPDGEKLLEIFDREIANLRDSIF